jgi:hypothetical protein
MTDRAATATALGTWVLAGIGIGALILTYYATTQSRKQFVATQRAAVYLGLRDGTLMKIEEPTEGDIRIIAFVTNYGQSTAENVQVELFPITDPIDGTMRLTQIPAFKGFVEKSEFTNSVPPGFPFKASTSYDPKCLKDLRYGKASLEVVGRITYRDGFGPYCEPFDVRYVRQPEGFELGEARNSVCGNKSFGLVTGAMPPGMTQSKPFIVPKMEKK